MQAYVACLKQHGVDLPASGRFFGNRNGQGGQSETPAQGSGNGSPPPSFDRQKFQAAQQACASLLPEGAQQFGNGPFGGGNGGGANASAFSAYRSCMSDHGVTLPDRQNGQRGENGSAPVSIERNSSTFQAANDVCKALLPNGGLGNASTQGTNP